jgi:type I restriction enzyme S subunit
MAAEWIETTIAAQATLQRGMDITRATQRPGAVPVISSGGVSSYHNAAAADGPGVVLGRKGVVGSVWFVEDDYWPHDTTLWVKDFHGNDRRFVYYFFKWMAPRLASLDVGSANPTLNRNHVHPITIRWPPPTEQRPIAHILGTLDDKIALNRRMSETLESMASALFKSWFVDFDPVRAKMTGRDPGLPKPLADLFPSRLVDSELGEIPEGWEVRPLPELVDVNPTRTLRRGAVAPYLDMANMPMRGHSPDVVAARAFGSGMRFTNGDTLVARITPCLENGKTAFVDFLAEGQIGWGSTEYIVLRPRPPLPAEFGYCLARSDEFREFAIQSMTGSSGRQRVPAESLSHFPLPLAPHAIAETFGRFVKPLFARAGAAARESRTLAALRDALLPRLVSGELRVANADKLVESEA